MAEPEQAPLLRLVEIDRESGEITGTPEECPSCARKAQLLEEAGDQIAGLQKDLTAWRLRYADLKRRVEDEAEDDPFWPVVERVFDFWRVQCKHPRAKLSLERFNLARPMAKRDGEALMMKAVLGAAFDPFITTRKNGSEKRHDGWDLVFRNREKFEEFCNRAPRG